MSKGNNKKFSSVITYEGKKRGGQKKNGNKTEAK